MRCTGDKVAFYRRIRLVDSEQAVNAVPSAWSDTDRQSLSPENDWLARRINANNDHRPGNPHADGSRSATSTNHTRQRASWRNDCPPRRAPDSPARALAHASVRAPARIIRPIRMRGTQYCLSQPGTA